MYARSLEEFGNPCELRRSGGWILRRTIPGFPYEDGMGCYPLFACRDWSGLAADLEELKGGLVAVSLVADPFGQYDEALLRSCFDVVMPYKGHFVVDRRRPVSTFVSKHHCNEARKALEEVRIERCPDPASFLDQWVRLYGTLIERYQLTGIRAFSRGSFEAQLQTPGTVIFRAVYEGETVGADWYYLREDVAYAHLSALSTTGYEVGAAYALLWTAIEQLDETIRWIALGGGAGVQINSADGLSRFKRGWSSETRTAYFCGRTLDRKAYEEIVEARGEGQLPYFPAYRWGEFR